MPCRVFVRLFPAFGDYLTCNAVDDERNERPLRHVGCEGYGMSHVAFVIHFHYRCATMKATQTIQITSKPRRLHATVRTQFVETKRRCTFGSNSQDNCA